MDELEQRTAQNEALFREVNERVEAVAHQLGPSIPHTPEVEELVVDGDACWVIRKTGEAAEYVKRVDPRRR